MPTKAEIYAAERRNDGEVALYPEGMFYKAYEKSAFLLCTKVSPLKVSRMTVKNLPEPLVRVGFPITSLEKFSNGMTVNELDGIIVASFPEKPSLDG